MVAADVRESTPCSPSTPMSVSFFSAETVKKAKVVYKIMHALQTGPVPCYASTELVILVVHSLSQLFRQSSTLIRLHVSAVAGQQMLATVSTPMFKDWVVIFALPRSTGDSCHTSSSVNTTQS